MNLYKNISELMDFPTPEHDRIKVTVKQVVYNKSGTKVMESEVVGIDGIELLQVKIIRLYALNLNI